MLSLSLSLSLSRSRWGSQWPKDKSLNSTDMELGGHLEEPRNIGKA
jgi:hypothetical protein